MNRPRQYVYTGAVVPPSPRARPSKDAVLAFILEQLAQDISPTPEQIRARMGWQHASSARACLRQLQHVGQLPAEYDRAHLGRRRPSRNVKRVLTTKGWENANA